MRLWNLIKSSQNKIKPLTTLVYQSFRLNWTLRDQLIWRYPKNIYLLIKGHLQAWASAGRARGGTCPPLPWPAKIVCFFLKYLLRHFLANYYDYVFAPVDVADDHAYKTNLLGLTKKENFICIPRYFNSTQGFRGLWKGFWQSYFYFRFTM